MGTGEALNDPMRKDSASSNSSSSSSRKDDGGVTDVEGGSTWSASTSVFSLSSGMSPPSSSFSPMDPPPSSSVGSGQHDGDAPVGSDAARFYDGDSGDREATGGSSRRGGVKITTTKRRYRKGDKDENAGKDPEDAHRGCLVVTCKSTSSTSTTSSVSFVVCVRDRKRLSFVFYSSAVCSFFYQHSVRECSLRSFCIFCDVSRHSPFFNHICHYYFRCLSPSFCLLDFISSSSVEGVPLRQEPIRRKRKRHRRPTRLPL